MTNPYAVTRATVQAHLLVMRYPLTGYRVAGKKMSPLCPLCQQEPETIDHFLLRCDALRPFRTENLQEILSVTRFLRVDLTTLTSIIVDPTSIKTPPDLTASLARSTRNLCYRLHIGRKRSAEAAANPRHSTSNTPKTTATPAGAAI